MINWHWSCPFTLGTPIVSEEELAVLAAISPAKTSQYSGSRVKALIQILQHQLDQQELVKEFLVRGHFMSVKYHKYLLCMVLQNIASLFFIHYIQALEHLKPSDNCLVAKAPENRDKNRYRDILPCKSQWSCYNFWLYSSKLLSIIMELHLTFICNYFCHFITKSKPIIKYIAIYFYIISYKPLLESLP